MNMFEISYSLNRQFGNDTNAIYRGEHLLSFVDNHDVTRISTILNNKKHLPLIYGLLFGMPSIPCIYYGSEWGIEGLKLSGNDDLLRPQIITPVWNELTELISKLAQLHKHYKSLIWGGYKSVVLTNRQLVFERKYQNEIILIAINADEQEFKIHIDESIAAQRIINLLTQENVDLSNGFILPAYSLFYWKIE